MNAEPPDLGEPLRIALDATPLATGSGGIRRYVEELAIALAENNPRDGILLLTDQPIPSPPERFGSYPNIELETAAGGVLAGKWWSLGLPRMLLKRRVRVFHGTDFAVPYLPVCPSVMTIHDLSPWKPEPISTGASERVRQRTPKLISLARRVLTPSEAVRKEVIEHFQIPETKVKSVPLAAGRLPAGVPPVDIRPPYFLFLAPGVPRKNFATALLAWRQARSAGMNADLVVAGEFSAAVPAPEPEPGLILAGPASDARLADLLASATAIVYPSDYEGFGLPVAEAMQAGTPVITSLDPAITETCGGAALQIDAQSVPDLRDALIRLMNDSDLAETLRRKGLDRASRLDWSRTAELTRRVYVEAILSA